jgi:DMSO/TMAO reductase YedYZ heme-binding membrane subunit
VFLVLWAWVVCVRRVGPYVWGEVQPLAYIFVLLTLNLIEQPFSPPNTFVRTFFCLYLASGKLVELYNWL